MVKEAKDSQGQSIAAIKKKDVKDGQACFTEVIKQNDLSAHKEGCPPPVPSRNKWVDETISKDTF